MAATEAPSEAPGRAVSPLAVPLLGVLAGIQGSDPNIASTAFVGATRGLDMVGGIASLAASISTLALAATVISTGLLADRLGRRKVLVAALVLSAIGDVIVALAPTAGIYLTGRTLAGIGLGAIYGAGFAYIRAVVPPSRIAAAMGVFGATTALTTVILSFLGGAISSLDWRLAFLVIPLACLLALVGVLVLLPQQPRVPGDGEDILGQVLLALTVIGWLVGFSHADKGLLDPWCGGAFVVGTLAAIGFVLVERRRRDHGSNFFPVELFRNPVFIAAICAGFVYNFGTAVGFLQLANLWQYVVQVSSLTVSLWQLPLLGVGIVAALYFGRRMSNGMTAGTALLLGTVITAVGFTVLALERSATSLVGFLPGMLLVGAGVIIASLPYGTLIISQAPPKFFGPVTSSRTTFGQFFYAAGLALGTVIIDKLTVGGVTRRLVEAGANPQQVGTGLDAVTTYATTGDQPAEGTGAQALDLAFTSYANSFGITMLVVAVLTLVVGLLGWGLLKKHGEPPPVEA
ncbi:MAG: MFS transporter [Candidatus Nanopelagicales bacterium]